MILRIEHSLSTSLAMQLFRFIPPLRIKVKVMLSFCCIRFSVTHRSRYRRGILSSSWYLAKQDGWEIATPVSTTWDVTESSKLVFLSEVVTDKFHLYSERIPTVWAHLGCIEVFVSNLGKTTSWGNCLISSACNKWMHMESQEWPLYSTVLSSSYPGFVQ